MNRFQQLHDAGFRHLLPIIPHDAVISRYSKTLQDRPEMLGKIPGKRVGDGWVGFYGWEHYTPDADDLVTWSGDQAGIGMRCEDVVAVDIDVTDPQLARLMQLEAMTHLGFAPVRHGNRPKALLLFRIDGDWPTKQALQFNDWSGHRHLIEVLGARQQFVVEGIHPKTGRPYSWSDDLTEAGLAGLPSVTPEDLAHYLQVCHDTLAMLDCEVGRPRSFAHDDPRSPELLRTDDLDALADTVAQIPNSDDSGYHDLTTMAHAIRAAADQDPDQGLAILQEWSSRWPHGHEPDETERIYWSIHESSIGVQWLYDEARRCGVDTVAVDFGQVPVAANDSQGAGEVEPFRADNIDNDDSWWSKYAYVNQIKRFVNLRTGAWLDKEQFNDRHRTPGAKQKPADLFLEHRQPYNFADTLQYRPGSMDKVWRDNQGQSLFNTWRPGPAHSGEWDGGPVSDLAVRKWLRLAEHVVPDAEQRNILFDWMASLLQRPGEKPNWHPLIGGKVHGTGKDSLLVPVLAGLGDNTRTIQAVDLESQWTWWADAVQLVVVSELASFDRRGIRNRLKSYMAAPPDTIEINRKGVPQYEAPNTFGLVMFSNNEDAVAIERNDRRFFVIWSEAEPLDDDFYADYHTWMKRDGAAAVARWLLHRDISHFSAQGRAPDTEAKEAMREATMDAVESTLEAAIEDEAGPFGADLFTLSDVETYLRARLRQPPPPKKIAVYLRSLNCHALGRMRVGSMRDRIWACRRQAMYEQAWKENRTRVRDMMLEQRERNSGATADFEGETKP